MRLSPWIDPNPKGDLMFKTLRRAPRRSRRTALAFVVVAGVAGLLGGAALAKVFTLKSAHHVKVVNGQTSKTITSNATVVVNSKGLAVYTLTGDSAKHPECTQANGCYQFWPPVKVKSAKGLSKAPGIKGKLGTWHHNGFFQLTINGHPLYTFFQDKKGVANGENIQGFGGIWHAQIPSGKGHVTGAPSSPAPAPGYPSGW